MIRVYYATNRDLTESDGKPFFGTGFQNDWPNNLRFGWADVIQKTGDDYTVHAVHLAEDPKSPGFDPTALPDGAVIGSRGTFELIRQEMQSGACDVICLIHGYASDFETALARAAEISVDYSTQSKRMIGFVFSWPSNGSMIPLLDYYSDRDDAKTSGFAIGRAFQLLTQFLKELKDSSYCQQSIHLVAHSMGNWALGNALDDIIELYNGKPPRLFDQVFLMAADADNDALEEDGRLGRLHQICNGINVYFSRDDRALMISDITKFNPDRLGATGPKRRDYLNRKVSLIDCRHVDQPDRTSEEEGKQWDLSVHQYYRLRREVIEDVQQILSGVSPADVSGRRFVSDDRSYQIVPFSGRSGS
ncbi:MAG: alpha/beta hydrolase [Rhodospirillales bacterium]|nr:alpha/beta hydrolase [Rhodospirillales bacterium]MDE0381285.1 alpha/beta hydrolase [Rhodospirillales bacterium]